MATAIRNPRPNPAPDRSTPWIRRLHLRAAARRMARRAGTT
ncbi:hypothetical protein [Calditerricola satsumensis]|nr:hypothetical protein [Calditerricola satsumensis]